MDEKNNLFKNSVYLIASLAGAGLIIYGAIFYTKNSNLNQQTAQILPSADNNQITPADFQEPILGDPNAPVTIIEYGSYLCGHCINFMQKTFPQLEEEYIKTNKVKYIYRSYPPLELGMALACASEQDKFWEYNHEAYYNKITKEDDLKTFAANLNLDTAQFNTCLDSEKYRSVAENWYKQGQDAGVTGTPTFFINGQKVVGDLPYEEIKATIEKALNNTNK